MSLRRTTIAVLVLIASLTFSLRANAGVGFQPISPDELKMTSEPMAPGAPAIILYREVYKDDCGITCHSVSIGMLDATRFEEEYLRIKILTEAGRKYGNVEIPLPREVGTVDDIHARTIRPDGSVVDFTGQVFEKTIVKAKGLHYVAQTFVMPDVQVGSIIECYFRIDFQKGRLFISDWILSDELFTKKAKFTLRPFQGDYYPAYLRWNEHLLPGMSSVSEKSGILSLEATNVPAFQAEDYMPPANDLKARVDFIYSPIAFEDDVNKFWKDFGKFENGFTEKFLGSRGAMEQTVSQIVSASDDPEMKIKKIYARVQQLHNTSLDPKKTEQEEKRERITTIQTAESVWKQGAGSDEELSLVFLALVRAAGFDAHRVLVANRHDYLFNPQSMQTYKLSVNAVLVKLNGKDLYLDPAGMFTPFGMLRWDETGVQGLRLDKDGGSWVQTPLPDSSASQIQRKADLKLSPSGDLEGKLVVTFTGLEGLRRRVDERNEDEVARKKALEDEVKGFIPVGSEVELTKQPDWTSSETPLAAEFNLKIPGWAVLAGHRMMFATGIFSGTEKGVFDHSERTHPIYFEYLSQKVDDVTVELPPGWQIASLPKAQNQDLHAVGYAIAAENRNGALHLTRKVDINVLTLEPKYYSPLRSFFQIVKAGDEQAIVFTPGAATATAQ